MVKGLRIGPKLIIGFLSVAVIAAIIGIFGVIQMKTIDEADTLLYEKGARGIEFLAQMNNSVQRVRVNLRSAFLSEDAAEIEGYLKIIQELHTTFAENEKLYLGTILEESARVAYQEYKKSADEYAHHEENMIALLRAGKKAEALSVLTGAGLKSALESGERMDKLIEAKNSACKNISDDNAKLADRSTVIMITIIIIGVIVSIILGVMLSRSVTGPLQYAVGFAGQVAAGDLTKRIDNQYLVRADEVGDLGRALDKMIEELSNIVNSASSGASQVAAASEQLAKGNQDLSTRTEQQASALEELASAMEEMGSSIKSNGDNSLSADKLAQETNKKADDGTKTVDQVVASMTEIDGASKKIADIIGIMNDIAFQTNLLALNASIEAARAGEQGRGFAVVAVEVRKLAQRSDEAAKEIAKLITTSNEQVDKGVGVAKKAGEALNEITDSIKKVSVIIAEISAASREQNESANQINKTVMSLNENTQQNSSLVEEAASATEELSSQAQELQATISYFKVADDTGASSQKNRQQKLLGQTAHHDVSKQFREHVQTVGAKPAPQAAAVKKTAEKHQVTLHESEKTNTKDMEMKGFREF